MSRRAQLELALLEMRRSYDRLSDNADKIDQKASWLLGSSNIIVGLFGLLQLTLLRRGQPLVYWVGVALVVIGYVGLMWSCIRVLAPRPYKYPVPADWDTLSKTIVGADFESACLTVLSSYVEHIPHNRQINEGKARNLRNATVLLAIIIALLVLLGLVPR